MKDTHKDILDKVRFLKYELNKKEKILDKIIDIVSEYDLELYSIIYRDVLNDSE